MQSNALYAYGIVKFGFDLDWKEIGISDEDVYTLSQGKFSVLVHNCKERAYTSKEPNQIKELITAHNKILDRAMGDFEGVIPLHFNTIIKRNEHSAEYNLKKWLKDDEERLERIWEKIKGKREYGIRIYYDEDKLFQEASANPDIKRIEEDIKGKSKGLNYLLKGKVDSRVSEIVQEKINQFKQRFYNDIKKITDNIQVNVSRISVSEEMELLLSLSILVKNQQIDKVKRILDKTSKDFSFQLAGPFAAYSFVENETKC